MNSPEHEQVLSSPIDGGIAEPSPAKSRAAGLAGSTVKRLWPWLLLGVLAAGVYLAVSSRSSGGSSLGLTTTKVVRSDLEIVVLEGGSIKALESLELKSQVEAREGAKILSIVDEGYEVTSEDVKNEKVLIKLDPTETKEKIEMHDIEYENAQTALTETDEARAIQMTESQNEIKTARQTARFALLDLEKYLGQGASLKVLAMRNLPATETALLQYEENFKERLVGQGSTPSSSSSDPHEDSSSNNDDVINRGNWIRVDFAGLLENKELGDGEAQQELRKRQDELLVAQSEFAVEQETVSGSEKLAKQQFITRATLDKEKVALKKAEIKGLSAGTSLELYRRYEFPKRAEELLTKYEDSLHALDREKKEALAKLSQAEAKYKNAEQMMKMANKKRDELNEQLESCTITATKPGLVVYGSNERDRYYYGGEEQIEEGASVRYKQTIITIPDMRRMGVKVNIQESHIKKVKLEQKVRITADAESDKVLSGEVKKVAVLPDSRRSYLSPNQKVYPTEIHIDGTHEWLKPGMSVKVEIITDELVDVLRVPLQAVMIEAGDMVAYVEQGGKPVRREIKAGEFNDEFIEISEGLEEDEVVFLSKPSVEGESESGEGEEEN